MNYICYWLLFNKIATSLAAKFKDDYPKVIEALEYNRRVYERADINDNSWRPTNFDEREEVARSPNDADRECENLFVVYANEFSELDVVEEINKCGGVDTIPKMKGVNKPIRPRKGKPRRRKRIIGVRKPNANHSHYPWTVFIRICYTRIYEFTVDGKHDSYTHSDRHHCTGSIIHRKFVLTAGHCFNFLKTNRYDNVAIKSENTGRIAELYDVVKEHEKLIRKHRKLSAKAKIVVTNVHEKIDQTEIYPGKISITSMNGKYDRVIQNPKNPEIIIEGDQNVKVHRGFIRPEEMPPLEIAYNNELQFNNESLPKRSDTDKLGSPPTWGINDAAIIYLGPDKDKQFIYKDDNHLEGVLPICLPAGRDKERWKRCSMQIGEEFQIAGYGVVRLKPLGLRTKAAKGLSSVRVKVRQLGYIGWWYYHSMYYGVTRSHQDENMSRWMKRARWFHTDKWWRIIKKRLGLAHDLGGATFGDSGAPMLAQRLIGQDVTAKRIFAMGIAGFVKIEYPGKYLYSTDNLALTEWIRNTMIAFTTPGREIDLDLKSERRGKEEKGEEGEGGDREASDKGEGQRVWGGERREEGNKTEEIEPALDI